MTTLSFSPTVRGLAAWSALALLSACGGDLFVGSDVMWAARHENGDLNEWTAMSQGLASATPPNLVEASTAQAHGGRFAAKLTVSTPTAGVQESATLGRSVGLPIEAYYSAWYHLPQPISVGVFWVIMKFRFRAVAGDPASDGELYDLDLKNLAGGGMSLRLYDHRKGSDVPLDVVDPPVPVGQWFQVEAFYRNAQDSTGRVTYWLDGRQIVDVRGQAMAPNPWVGWQACSVGETLNPTTAALYIDDAAISRTRVGPAGVIAR